MTTERLQKILAAAGFGSRRACEEIIAQGRVEINGRTATVGMSGDPAVDKIRVDGRPLPKPAAVQAFALYKPRGVVSSLDPQGERRTVRDLLPVKGRFYPVGRLDMDSEGLIVLTNDGDLAQRVSHPSYEIEKEYLILLARRPTVEQLEIWRRGVVLEDGFRTSPMSVRMESTEGKGAWVRAILHEGRKHELREIGSRIGLPVVRIVRQRIGALRLSGLKPGLWRELTPEEMIQLATNPVDKPAGRPAGRPAARPRRPVGSRSRPQKRNPSPNRDRLPARNPSSDRDGPPKRRPFSKPDRNPKHNPSSHSNRPIKRKRRG